MSQPQPAKVVILSERGQEKSGKHTILRRRVLEKQAESVNSSEGLRLGMMLSQQAAGRPGLLPTPVLPQGSKTCVYDCFSMGGMSNIAYSALAFLRLLVLALLI